MDSNKDIHSFVVEEDIVINSTPIGKTIITYYVEQYIDVRNSSMARSYKVACTQRIIIPNRHGFDLTPQKANSFESYPALLSNEIEITPSSGDTVLMSYSPKTLNSAVSTSLNHSATSGSSDSQQHTIGSSTSQTNSYGGSASLGFFGDTLTGNITGNYEHSKTKTKSKSDTTGSESSSSSESGSGDNFSIKDWGSYASIDAKNVTPTWVWGQEYPWDVIQYRYCPTDNNVVLPDYVQSRLWDTKQVYPPSSLSLFGIDFTMKSGWLITPDDKATTDQTVTFTHTLEYVTATHGVTSGKLVVTLMPSPGAYGYTPQKPLDLCELALNPILSASINNGAVVGFISNKFIIKPTSASNHFKIISGDNNLLVTGSGFDNAMTTTFSNKSAKLIVKFKILDSDNNYTVYMKHWKTNDAGCTLTFTINGDKDNPIIKTVNALESNGGDNNMTAINLRNKDYSSVDYHDYLQLGMNTIEIDITPDSSTNACYGSVR